jgi:hypothetical protein
MSKSADHAAEALQAILAAISTNDLIAELVSREGIDMYTVAANELGIIQKFGDGKYTTFENYHGPTQIISVVKP